MFFSRLLCFVLVAALLVVVSGCDSGGSSPKNIQSAVNTSVSRKLAVVSPEFQAAEKNGSSRSSHASATVFAKNGSGFAYVEPFEGKYRVVHNGQSGKPYLAISELIISTDGKRVAYVASFSESLNKFVVDGREGYAAGADDNHWFSADGKVYISTVTQSGTKYFVINNNLIQKYRIENVPVLSPDTGSIAFSVKSSVDGRTQVVISDLALQNATLFNSCGDFVLPNDDNSRIALGCSEGGKTSIKVVDMMSRAVVSTSVYDGTITKMKFSPFKQSLSYTYFTKDSHRYVVYNGKEEAIPAGVDFLSEPLVFSDPESVGVIIGDFYKANLYRAFQKQDKIGKKYGFISDFTSSRDGRNYAYIAVNLGSIQQVVVNGHDGPTFDKIVDLQFSPDGRLLTYRARQGENRFLVVSNLHSKIVHQHRNYNLVFHQVISEDSASVAYGALDGNELWWKVEKL